MADITTPAGQQTLGVQRRYVDRGDNTVAEVVEADQESWARAVSGQYFRATNPTWGTGIAAGVVTGFVATTPLLVVDNTDVAGGVSIFIDYIKLINTAAGTLGVSGQMGCILDVINRYASGGSALTAVNSRSGKATTAKASIHFGAVTAAAASAAKQITRDAVKTQAAPCWVPGDEVFVIPGALDMLAGPTSGAATAIYPAPTGPIVVDPGHSFLLYLWSPSQATAASWEIEMGWWEKNG